MFAEGLERILRTGRSEAACSRSKRGDAGLIETYQQHEWKDDCLPDSPCGLTLHHTSVSDCLSVHC